MISFHVLYLIRWPHWSGEQDRAAPSLSKNGSGMLVLPVDVVSSNVCSLLYSASPLRCSSCVTVGVVVVINASPLQGVNSPAHCLQCHTSSTWRRRSRVFSVCLQITSPAINRRKQGGCLNNGTIIDSFTSQNKVRVQFSVTGASEYTLQC